MSGLLLSDADFPQTTESKIKVFTESCPDSDDQVVQVRGTTRAIIRCIRGIFRTIENVRYFLSCW